MQLKRFTKRTRYNDPANKNNKDFTFQDFVDCENLFLIIQNMISKSITTRYTLKNVDN